MQNASLANIFTTFFKVGATTFGGGYAMLPVIKREVVERLRWLTDDEFVDALAVAQSSPGAVAINISVFIGCKLRRYPGAFAALLGSVLPSFLVILAIAAFFARYTESPFVIAAFTGIRPAIAALIAAAVLKLGKPALKKRQSVLSAGFFLLFAAGFGLHPFIIILLGAGSGILLSYLAAKREREGERQ